jgi:phage recombination protein Bet
MNNVVPMTAVMPIRPRDYTGAQLDLVKRTVAADCSPDEFNLFVEVCKRVGLDPFRRQIYAVVYSKDNADKRKMSIITGIDGFRAVAARGGQYRPDEDEPAITYLDDLKDSVINPLGIEKAVVTCWKYGPDHQWHPLKGVAYWDEFAPLKEKIDYVPTGEKYADGNPKKEKRATGIFTLDPTSKWKTMARVMIAKCAEAQAIRKGWPEDLSGVYAPEEMAKAEVEDKSASEVIEEHRAQLRLTALNAGKSVPIQWKAGDPVEYVPDGQFHDKACAFVKEAVEPQLNAFMNINRHALQEFWARNKVDALDVKRHIEARQAEFAQANG